MNGGDLALARERAFDVDGLRLAALEWGEVGGTPVMALHGWMDHAASFQELAPRLVGCHVVALDLSGQGLSSHRAAHATYNIWDDLPQIAEVLDLLGWDDCVLIGHSRGANIATLFAAAQPKRVRALVALDSLVVEPKTDEGIVETLRAFVEQTRVRKARPLRSFPSKEAYIERRCRQGNAALTSQALAARALEPVPEGVRVRGDSRMFASSAVKLTRAQVGAVLGALECPVLNIWASDGLRKTHPRAAEMAKSGRALISDYTVLEFDGDHHLHLVPDTADRIARAILAFIDR
jgi:pimeloyl-ACP methyl ester carboxylesterase